MKQLSTRFGHHSSPPQELHREDHSHHLISPFHQEPLRHIAPFHSPPLLPPNLFYPMTTSTTTTLPGATTFSFAPFPPFTTTNCKHTHHPSTVHPSTPCTPAKEAERRASWKSKRAPVTLEGPPLHDNIGNQRYQFSGIQGL